jgi:hypothetical protein
MTVLRIYWFWGLLQSFRAFQKWEHTVEAPRLKVVRSFEVVPYPSSGFARNSIMSLQARSLSVKKSRAIFCSEKLRIRDRLTSLNLPKANLLCGFNPNAKFFFLLALLAEAIPLGQVTPESSLPTHPSLLSLSSLHAFRPCKPE